MVQCGSGAFETGHGRSSGFAGLGNQKRIFPAYDQISGKTVVLDDNSEIDRGIINAFSPAAMLDRPF